MTDRRSRGIRKRPSGMQPSSTSQLQHQQLNDLDLGGFNLNQMESAAPDIATDKPAITSNCRISNEFSRIKNDSLSWS